jgi:hypothetical protein
VAEPETLPCHNGGQTVKLYRGEHGAASGRENRNTDMSKSKNMTPDELDKWKADKSLYLRKWRADNREKVRVYKLSNLNVVI